MRINLFPAEGAHRREPKTRADVLHYLVAQRRKGDRAPVREDFEEKGVSDFKFGRSFSTSTQVKFNYRKGSNKLIDTSQLVYMLRASFNKELEISPPGGNFGAMGHSRSWVKTD